MADILIHPPKSMLEV